MSTTLVRLDSPDSTFAGGFLIQFPSGAAKTVTWVTRKPIQPPLEAAKDYAARVLQACLDERRIDDADRTNWPSVTAAIQRVITDFNARLQPVETKRN